MAAIDDALEANREYAERFDRSGLPRRPTRGLVAVACMDARMDVPELLGLGLGEAHIIRNAGAVVTEDVLRSLLISHYTSGTREFMIINHTKCALLTVTDEELLAEMKKSSGDIVEIPSSLHAFTDLEENVRRQVHKARSHPWIPRSVSVRGFIYDVDSGRLREISV